MEYIERARTFEDLRDAYKLVYEIYAKNGLIVNYNSSIRLRVFEASPNMATFIAKKDGKIIGVLSVIGDSQELGLPSDESFKEELDILRQQGLKICEMTNQVVAEESRKGSIFSELMRCAAAHCFKFGYDENVATISPNHYKFYNFMGFRKIGEQKSYSKDYNDPVIPMSINTQYYCKEPEKLNRKDLFIYNYFITEGKYFLDKVVDWKKDYQSFFLNRNLLKKLFYMESGFLLESDKDIINKIENLWGKELLNSVLNN